MKPCPFCGKKVEARIPFLDSFIDRDGIQRWNLSHHCNFGGDLTVTIDCWGDTKKECIEKWNRRVEAKEKNKEVVLNGEINPTG